LLRSFVGQQRKLTETQQCFTCVAAINEWKQFRQLVAYDCQHLVATQSVESVSEVDLQQRLSLAKVVDEAACSVRCSLCTLMNAEAELSRCELDDDGLSH